MAEIVNLRQARKAKKRADEARAAEANRIAFGRSKAERTLSRKEKDLSENRLDGHRLRDRDDPAS
jgi:hypothetical protein